MKSNKNYAVPYHPERATLNNFGAFFPYVVCTFTNLRSHMYIFHYYKHFLVQKIPKVSVVRRTGKIWKLDQGAGRVQTPSRPPAPLGMGLGGPAGGLWDCSPGRAWLQVRGQEGFCEEAGSGGVFI